MTDPNFQPGDKVLLKLPGRPDREYTIGVDLTINTELPTWVLPTPKRPAGLVDDEDLQVGSTYRVEFDDCCVGGEFTSVLAEIFYDERHPTYPDQLRWATGVVLSQWGQAEFWEAG